MNPGTVYEGLKYPSKLINREYMIKVNGVNYNGKYMTLLVGVSGLVNLIGIELSNKLFNKAMKFKGDVLTCKLRRGLIIRFYRR